VKLEKIEFGGMRGRILTAQTLQIFDEFQNAYRVFGERSYDSLDPASGEFPADYNAFQAKVEDLERRLGAIACQAFDDANGPEAAFKVIFVLGGLLERPIIAHDFESRYHKLVAIVDAEMDEAKRIYDEYYTQVRESGGQMHEKNMPPISGALKWSSELFGRISAPVSNMRHIEHECASPYA
jgi:dynein heavy chain